LQIVICNVLDVRKGIVMGAIGVMVIGFAAYLAWQPKNGTVEWHCARYVALLMKDTLAQRLHRMWGDIRGRRAVVRKPSERVARELELHERALIRLGYFEERRFLVFNGRAEGVMERAVSLWRNTQSNAVARPQFDRVYLVGENGRGEMGSVRSIGRTTAGELAESLIIVTRPERMPQWAEFVQRSDSARSKTNLVHKSRFVPVRR
jgi:hypothetical protein